VASMALLVTPLMKQIARLTTVGSRPTIEMPVAPPRPVRGHQLIAQPHSELARLRQADKLVRTRVDLLSRLSSRFTFSLDLPVVLRHLADADRGLTFDISSDERERMGSTPQGLGIFAWLHELKGPVRLVVRRPALPLSADRTA
jgi:hypothetical protein